MSSSPVQARWLPTVEHTDIDILLARARMDILVITSTSTMHDGGPDAISRLIEGQVLRNGVRPRLLVPQHCLPARTAADRLTKLANAGVIVRTVPNVSGDAVVIDGSLVVRYPDRYRLPRSEAATVVPLLDCLWTAGAPFTVSEFSSREREVLSMLSEGRTDESMAAELKVSARTVHRMIATLKERLGARSRFQAGVLAANLGWPIPVARRPSA